MKGRKVLRYKNLCPPLDRVWLFLIWDAHFGCYPFLLCVHILLVNGLLYGVYTALMLSLVLLEPYLRCVREIRFCSKIMQFVWYSKTLTMY